MNLYAIDQHGGRALHRRIRVRLEFEIRTRMSAGESIAEIDKLARRYQVSRHVIRRALDELYEDEVVAVDEAGRHYVPFPAQVRRIADLPDDDDPHPRRIIRCLEICAGGHIRDRLQLRHEGRIHWVEIIEGLADTPTALHSYYFPSQVFSSLIPKKQHRDHTLLRCLAELPLHARRSDITIQALSGNTANLLQLNNGALALRERSLFYDKHNEQPLMYRISHYPADQAKLLVDHSGSVS